MKRIPAVIVIDHQNGRLTVDGEELLPGHWIAQDVSVDVSDNEITRVDLGIFTDNVLIRSRTGTSSPTAEAEAKRIVRKGLADVLNWLDGAA